MNTPFVSVLISAAAFAMTTVTGGTPAAAAELKVFASTGVKGVISELGPRFEAAASHKLVVDYDVVGPLKRRAEAGEHFDALIQIPALVDDLIKQGKIAADTRANIGRTGLGIGVRKGAPKPDLSSTEAFRRSMLAAKSVAYPKEGGSGALFLAVLDRIGIAAEMTPKLRGYDSSGMMQAVGNGEAEMIATGLGPILEMPGVDLAGMFPPELQTYIVFAAGVSTATKEPDAGKALVRFLTGPAAAPIWKAKGIESMAP
jgi:molybdate transport system substrate-binding protein